MAKAIVCDPKITAQFGKRILGDMSSKPADKSKNLVNKAKKYRGK